MGTAEEFQLEQSILQRMLTKIRKRVVSLEEKSFQQKEHVKNLYSLYTPENTEYHTDIPVAEQLARYYENDLREIQKIETNPYFGKILLRFDADDVDNTYYIGKKAVDNETGTELSVIDWRAPIADVYYSGKLGQTGFRGPKGIQNVELKLKRTLKIRNSILESLYDAEVVANDELLLDYLSQNKGLVLNEIIATIQDEQNEIIRKPLTKNLIVQGVAGSGKTTVAIHRISFLLYSYREELSFENVLLIAGNPLFLHYITSMLPDLDVPVIKQDTMRGLLSGIYKELYPETEITETGGNPLYGNSTYLHSFDEFVQKIEEEVFREKELSFLGSPLLPAYRIENVKNKRSLSLLERAKALDEMLVKSIALEKDHILTTISRHKEDPAILQIVKRHYKPKSDYLFDSELEANYSKLMKSFRSFYTQRIKKLNAKKLFEQFTGHKGDARSLCDMACHLSLYLKINGWAEYRDIRHIVIDEAQDFNLTIYVFLRLLFPGATFTIVGDIMQNVEPNGLDSWDSLKPLLYPQTEYKELLKGYRNTYEIAMFAKNVMETVRREPFLIDPLKRHGDPVRCIAFQALQQKIEITKEILNSQITKNHKLNALICKNPQEVETLLFELNHTADMSILSEKSGSLEYGNYIVDIKNAKGLEFDSVIIWDFDSYAEADYKLLYVAMTRALHNLYVFTNNEKWKGGYES